ncbi:hypothetical protein [Millisia brevis]|uniref:hypothetical protein n=1 Tax=Millisia brevis TaxID=264148 RepID=UPI0008305732|nr:hypothetical protein [Millisia brevis]
MTGRFDPADLPPEMARAYRIVERAADDLATLTARAERERGKPIVVDADYLRRLAELPDAGPQLRAFAERVERGESEWDDIEHDCRPLPPEVDAIRRSANFEWALRPSLRERDPDPDVGRPYRLTWVDPVERRGS